MRAEPRRKGSRPPSNAARSRSRPSGIVHLIPKKLVLAGDRFCSTNISTRISSSMLNPSAHQATPVRVLGTIDCAGVSIGAGDSRIAGGAISDGCGGASAPLSGGNGPPIVWLTWKVIPRTDALRHRTIPLATTVSHQGAPEVTMPLASKADSGLTSSPKVLRGPARAPQQL